MKVKFQCNFRNFIVFCPLSCYVTYEDTVQSFDDQKEEKKKKICRKSRLTLAWISDLLPTPWFVD